MKILVTSNVYFPLLNSGAVGGIEKYASDMYKLLTSEGHSVFLLCSKDSEIIGDTVIHGDFSKEYIVKNNLGSRYSTGETQSAIEHLSKSHKFDLVIDNFTNLPLNKKIASSFNCSIIKMTHVILYFRNSYDYQKSLLDIARSRNNYHVLAVSEFCKNSINAVLPDAISGVLSPNYISVGDFQLLNTPSYYVYVGRIAPDKHVDFLVDVFKDWDEELIIIGNKQQNTGSEDSWYDAKIKPWLSNTTDSQYTKNNIHYIGPMYPPDLYSIMTSSIACLNANNDESYPLSLFESQKLGIPAITLISNTPHGAQEFIIEDKTGYSAYTYRKRYNSAIDAYRTACKRARSLDRQFIHQHFQSTYTSKKYIENLLEYIK